MFELEQERKRYAELFDLLPDAYLVTDPRGLIVEANRGAARLLEVSPGELSGKQLSRYVERGARQVFRLELAGSNGEPRRLDVPFVSGSGRRFPARVWVAGGDGEQGGTGSRRCIVRDVTSELELEGQSQVEGAELRRMLLLLERLQEGIIAVDSQLRVEFANTEAMRMLAPAPLQKGKPLPDPWPDLSLPTLSHSLFGEEARVVAERIVRGGDGARSFSVVGIPAQQTNLALLVIVDISDRERRERAEREFVANAAHELRTPLAAITAAVELLQAGAKEIPGDRDHFLAHLERETARLTRLAKALLLLARSQTGDAAPRAELVDLRELLEETAAAIDPAHGVAVEVTCVERLAALANRDLAAQALFTIAANAAKYTEEGLISFVARRHDDSKVVVEVADTGPGIPAEERELVRRRFYRLGGRSDDGFGLGLAIAEQAVAAMGGTLELDSATGQGTTVRIVLPGAELVR